MTFWPYTFCLDLNRRVEGGLHSNLLNKACVIGLLKNVQNLHYLVVMLDNESESQDVDVMLFNIYTHFVSICDGKLNLNVNPNILSTACTCIRDNKCLFWTILIYDKGNLANQLHWAVTIRNSNSWDICR